MSFLPVVKIWIWISVLASVAGWTLGAIGFLNGIGYAVFGFVAVFVLIQASATGAVKFPAGPWRWRNCCRRLRRPFPLLFTLLAVLVLLGGLLYPPTNHTGLSYRIPRVLHWLAQEEWHWIYAPNLRMNTRACGMEWLSAPLLLFTKSDRGLFLLNFIPFLLLPGLIFSVFTRLGVRARVAWPWMWLLPTGYVFLLQAGSAGNDAYPAVYALAAVDFACRAWRSRRATDLWHAFLAIALLNGAKASNLPLTLPWLVLVLPLWRLLKDKPAGTARVAVLGLLASFVPTALLNIHYTGSWSALHYERAGMEMGNPFVGVFGNAFLLLVNNLCPPLFPLAGWWNQHALQLLPGVMVGPMVRNFEDGFHVLWELPTEDWAGVGAGVTVLAIISAVWAVGGWRARKRGPEVVTGIPRRIVLLALMTPWVALMAYGAKSGMVTPARLIAPYYALLLPLLLVGPEQVGLVRRRWWRVLAGMVFVVAFGVLIVTPPRPLWPAKTVLTRWVDALPEDRLLQRALATYTAYSVRADPHAELRALLPADLDVVGFLGTHDDLDISFWKPYGGRRVAQIGHRETAELVRARKLKYAVVSGLHFELARQNFEDWLTAMRAEVVAQKTLTISLSAGAQSWYIVRFRD